MKIDILSDLHLDFYFKGKPKVQSVESVFSRIFDKENIGDALIVAGDIGHNNKQNIQVLKLIKEIFGYKYIICVLGNHDFYLLDKSLRSNYDNSSILRAARMRKYINDQEGMYCLNGEVVVIDGVRIGGCDSWYDGEYIKENFDKVCPLWNVPKDAHYINQLWEHSLNDANYIYGMDWQKKAELEKQKIEKIYQDVDIMITHVNPSLAKEHTSRSYRETETTGFFTFDGRKYLEKGSMKYWIYGHTHDAMEYEMQGVRCICNPLGYPSECHHTLRSIEI